MTYNDTSKKPFAYSAARAIAISVCQQLQEHCEALNIAGSLRRKKSYVKDIEILVKPKMVIEHDLFGAPIGSSPCTHFVKTVLALGRVIKGKPTGRYMQIELPEGIVLDLFIPQPGDYARQYAIRTGSATYAQHVIAAGWKRLGWVGTEDGLRKQHECEEKKTPDGKSKWTCKVDSPTLPPAWETEDDFFVWLGLIGAPPPQHREM